MRQVLTKVFILLVMMLPLAACVDDTLDVSKLNHKEVRLSSKTRNKIAALGMDRYSPIMIRIFKEEGVLEVWKAKRDGRFALVKDYQICAWSGMLGPKIKEGDRQAPEGFYDITPGLLNPNSNYYLAFNIGYPNAFDQSHRRTGSDLMVHGACSSRGCYSMTDLQMQEIFALAKDAFKGGQRAFQVQALPFRMTAENMARHKSSAHMEFWKMLKVGYDHFEITHRPPAVAVCGGKYVFNAASTAGFNAYGRCPENISTPPALASAYTTYQAEYEREFAAAERKYEGLVWHEPTEAQRKALVAGWRAQHKDDLAFAPTGSALKAGKLLKLEELKAQEERAADEAAARALAASAEKEAAKKQVASDIPVPEQNPVVDTAATEPEGNKLWSLFSFWKK